MPKISELFLGLLSLHILDENSYTEPYRPQFHYTPYKNWMNDPNGLFRDVNGIYHMFYQYNPYGNEWGDMSWGHATGIDMVNWQEQPIAIPESDGVMIFSGSTVIDYWNTTGLMPWG